MHTAVGIGVVGAGRIFEQHARACAALGRRARLLAIADVDEARLRSATSQYFIPFAYDDYRRLVERDDIEVVVVCTPPAMHERIVIDALQAGKFVVCEKPLAHTLEAADRIVAVARRFPGKLSTVYQLRFLPEVQRTLWLRDHDRLGRLLFGRFSRYARFETSAKPAKAGKAAKPGKPRADWWGRWDVAGGGVAMTQLIHELDLMCCIFGRAREVDAVADTLKDRIESEDTCAATVRFESGALVCCYGTMTSHRSSHAFDVIGDLASTHYPWALEGPDHKRCEQSRRDVLAAHPSIPDAATPRAGLAALLRGHVRRGDASPSPAGTAHAPYLAAVLDAVVERRPLPIGPDEARASLELCTAIYESAVTGRRVALPLADTSLCYRGLTAAAYNLRRQQQPHADAALESPAWSMSGSRS